MPDQTAPRLSDGTSFSDLMNLDRKEVSLRFLHDPEIYQLELERVFGRTWLLLGHASEIPGTGDYVVRYMGEDSVIVARDREGDIHVSLNVCPHRGMRICTGDAGTARAHRCMYHGWSFRPDGSFLGALAARPPRDHSRPVCDRNAQPGRVPLGLNHQRLAARRAKASTGRGQRRSIA